MVEVRPAVENEGWAIGALRSRAWQAAYRGRMPDEMLDEMPLDEEVWQSLARREHGEQRLWVAFAGGKIVGYCHTGPSRDAGAPAELDEVYGLYVEPDLIGFGVGNALFERAIADLRERGSKEVTLWVMEDAPRARRFYETAGWTADGARRDTCEGVDGIPVVRYRLAI
ncbi:MAG TPA: GNAT family N-acetyltransferase [Candidatus Dormibacteraeota bacterium]|nr:GNAT family N-acetyltransferase [Candidatus Dormibacteraeota bacterium]